MAACQNLVERRLPECPTQRLQSLDRLSDLGRASFRLGDHPGDRLAVPGYAHGSAALDFIQ